MTQSRLVSRGEAMTPRCGGGADRGVPSGTDVIGDSLETIERLYAYNHWVYRLICPYVTGRVLEVGCGVGTITGFLSMGGREVVGIDPVEHFVRRFKNKFAHVSNVSVKVGYLQDMPRPQGPESQFDTVVSCNVLEHIQDDVEAVSLMAAQLRFGGRVVVFVPAGRIAFGRLDRQLGHHRRYSIPLLRRVFCEAGLVWAGGRYSNAVGLLGWWWNSVVLRRRQVPTAQAAMLNRIVPLLSAIERVVSLPFGQSVVGVGIKVSHTANSATATLRSCHRHAA